MDWGCFDTCPRGEELLMLVDHRLLISQPCDVGNRSPDVVLLVAVGEPLGDTQHRCEQAHVLRCVWGVWKGVISGAIHWGFQTLACCFHWIQGW